MGQFQRYTWQRIRQAVKRQARKLNRKFGAFKKSSYSDELIALMFFWCVLHDRPLCWAAERDAYNTTLFRPRRLPSRSQFGRRVNSERFQILLQMIHFDILGPFSVGGRSYFDGKPLVVGVASSDPDAKRGHVMGGFAKGYKLHVWADENRKIAYWCVDSLNVDEKVAAEAIIAQMPMFTSQAMVLADANYDTQGMYEALAEKNAGLLTKPRGMDLDHVEQWAQSRHPKNKPSRPVRQEALDTWEKNPGWSAWLYKDRINVEGTLSNLCSFAGGLGPLPSWVRRLHRVRRWVGAKIIIYLPREIGGAKCLT
jgi:hypothetical protein